MAFPGGRQDPADESLLRTAIRETHEEIGVELHPSAHFVGRLDDLPAIARSQRFGLVIAPFVFALPEGAVVAPNPAEVAEIVWAPLSPLLLGERDAVFPYAFGEQSIDLPAFDVEGRIVWGLTHQMLFGLFDVLDGRNRLATLPY